MSMISVDYDVLNQRGSPAWYSDVFASIPTPGYKGRMFISTDTFAFYRDTGTGWDLIGGPGIGTLTGSGVVGQVSFFNGTQVLAGNNNLFWDNVNSRLGINTTTPGAPLDIHGTGTQIQLNGTGVSNSYIAYQQNNIGKWRVGNFFDGTLNTFAVYNTTLSSNALTISNTTNNITLTGVLNGTTAAFSDNGNALNTNLISLLQPNLTAYNGPILTLGKAITINNAASIQFYYTSSGSSSNSLTLALYGSTGLSIFGNGNGSIAGSFTIGTTLSNGTYNYTLPSATGTLALTSNLSSYLPLTGGTLTGGLYINPTNTGIVGLDVASNTTIIRSDNLEGFKRQLEIVMGSGTLVQLTAKGFGANYGTDMAFYTATTGGTNASPGIYITGTNNRVGIKTGTPAYDLDVTGTFGVSSTSYFAGSVGIGTSSPATLLEAYKTSGSAVIRANYNGTTFFDFTASSSGNVFLSTGNNAMILETNSTERMRITSGGHVYMGSSTTDKTSRLVVYGETTDSSKFALRTFSSGSDVLLGVRNDGLLVSGTLALSPYNNSVTGRSMQVNSGGVIGYLVSTRESKANIESIKNINFINQLNPVQFNYRKKDNINNVYTDELYNNINYGFIADEVEKVNKELVFYNEDGSLAGVEYNSIIAILTKAIQELNEKLVKNKIN